MGKNKMGEQHSKLEGHQHRYFSKVYREVISMVITGAREEKSSREVKEDFKKMLVIFNISWQVLEMEVNIFQNMLSVGK